MVGDGDARSDAPDRGSGWCRGGLAGSGGGGRSSGGCCARGVGQRSEAGVVDHAEPEPSGRERRAQHGVVPLGFWCVLPLGSMCGVGAGGDACRAAQRWQVDGPVNPEPRRGCEQCSERCVVPVRLKRVPRSGSSSPGRARRGRSPSGGTRSSWHIQPIPNPPGSRPASWPPWRARQLPAAPRRGPRTRSSSWNGGDGARWRIQPSGAGRAQFSELSGVTCTAVASCVAVGEYATSSGADVTLAERWNRARWSIQATPSPSGAGGAVLFGVSWTSGVWSCMAVGTAFNSQARMFSERWNGATWASGGPSRRPPGAQSSLFAQRLLRGVLVRGGR